MAPRQRVLIPLPEDVGDFYVSGSGHLCARVPWVHVVIDEPVLEGPGRLVGRASEADLLAHVPPLPPGMCAVVIERE